MVESPSDLNSKSPLTRYELSNILMATLIGLTSLFAIDMHLPSLPFIIKYFNATVGLGQSSISLYLISMLIIGLVYGPLSDRIGRKPTILIGYIIACIGTVVCILAPTITIFLIGRIIQGLGGAVGMTIGASILNDVLSKYKLAVYGSYFSVILSLGILSAPLIGGYSQKYMGWKGTFTIMGLFFIITFLIMLTCFKETRSMKNNNKHSLSHIMNNYRTLLKSHIFMIYSVISGIAVSTILVYASTSSFLFQTHFKLSPIMYGWIGFIIAIPNIIGKVIAGALVKKTGIKYGTCIGLYIFTITGLVFLIADRVIALNATHVIIFVSIATLGQGFIFSNALSGAISNYRSMGGTASALYRSIQYAAAFISVFIISVFSLYNIFTLAISYFILGFIGLILIYTERPAKKPATPTVPVDYS